ncbi:DUF6519 domain-containing protein [Ruegeria sp. 2205SS24-7]|uniref:DUF6519 domain-containing protein n=1 Tax=Ruegeria discodermiae TaxID=3064389 RepID=UPI002740A040|nr:DUF6519 domain-containing protein [Ruegeria sp. 2205SS24-7]MDP5220849.1 DUF6519 domain-containing protein [Ruegeria sp. 2205SS24-7]
MTFDLSRVRFNPRQDFLGVIMQQGRVQLDSDWNEWVAELSRRIQAGTLDTFNGSVVPRITPDGFLINVAGGEMTIGAGRMYVDGILAENHGMQPAAWDSLLAEETGTGPVPFDQQPYFPNAPDLPTSGRHLAYVVVWQREVSPIEDPTLIEPAVGVDTTGRLQTVWQVQLHENIDDSVTCTTPDEDIPGWPEVIAPSAGRLGTATGDPGDDPNPCEVPPAAGYLGLENQLYRVEVHRGGPFGTASFKWSRENGSVASRVTHINGARDRITVESLGRDDVLGFQDGDWVEVTDDWRELHNEPGELRRIAPAGGVDRTARTLTFETALPNGMFPTNAQQQTNANRNTRVRRWDQTGAVRSAAGNTIQNLDTTGAAGIQIPVAGTQVFLEHGILVDFNLDPAGGEFHTGDHWVFAARTADASIEILDEAPPLGIHRHYARLAIVDFPENEIDCRTLWPPIHEGGDSCDCTVCVTAEEHNAGTATIQQAIDQIQDVGGTICLEIGSYDISTPLNITNPQSLKIRGQGWRTLLTGSQPGPIITTQGGIGLTLENFTIMGVGDSDSVTAMIDTSNITDLNCLRLNVLAVPVPDRPASAIRLSGLHLRTRIRECVLAAQVAIQGPSLNAETYLLSAEVDISGNVLVAERAGVSMGDACLHFGTLRLAENLLLANPESGISLSGASFPGGTVDVDNNVITSENVGLFSGVDNLSARGNSLTGDDGLFSDGIVLGQGLDPRPTGNMRVADNHLRQFGGTAIRVTHPVLSASVTGNLIEDIGTGAFVMAQSAAAQDLRLSENICRRVGLQAQEGQVAYAAIQLIRVVNGDVIGNTVAEVATDAFGLPSIAALRVGACSRLRMAHNRLIDIGPMRGDRIAAVRAMVPFDHIALSDNALLRRSTPDLINGLADWRAVDIGAEPVDIGLHTAPSSVFSAGDDTAVLLTDSYVALLPLRDGDVTVRGNEMLSALSRSPIVRVEDNRIAHCLFSENVCSAFNQDVSFPPIGRVFGNTISVTNNRLRCSSFDGGRAMVLSPNAAEAAIVLGNTMTLSIQAPSTVPTPQNQFNIIGV